MSIRQGNSIIAGIGANTDLSNLTDVGANIGNWSHNVTNCITEIPNDIKLELNNGTLTLKAGSKVYVPNGSGVFDTITITSDLTCALVGGSGTFTIIYDTINNTFKNCVQTYSGSTQPTGTLYSNAYWYDTTNNIIKKSDDGGSTWSGKYSFPIGIIYKTSDSSVDNIKHVFNGFGYIGSTVFALPGVKGLIPNGRNADGTLNNTEFTVSSVQSQTLNAPTLDVWMVLRDVNGEIQVKSTDTHSGGYDYNQNYNIFNNAINNSAIFATIRLNSSNRIIAFLPKTAFVAVDYGEFTEHKLVDFQAPTSANNYTWYRKYADGWVEQGGVFSDRRGTVTLPIPMDNTSYTILHMPYVSTTPTTAGIPPYVNSITTQGFYFYNNNGGATLWSVFGLAA